MERLGGRSYVSDEHGAHLNLRISVSISYSRLHGPDFTVIVLVSTSEREIHIKKCLDKMFGTISKI